MNFQIACERPGKKLILNASQILKNYGLICPIPIHPA
jgi:hypothetical protein